MPSSPPPQTTPGPQHTVNALLPTISVDTNSTPSESATPANSSPTRNGARPSIQFVHHPSLTSLRTGSSKSGSARPKLQGRYTSPPPPSSYENRVSFDTFDNRDATDFSFTLKSKHRHYAYTKRSRTFLCGTDQNDYSEFALEWLLDELVDDGDEVVCLRVVDKDSKINSDTSVEAGRYRTEAHKLLEHIKAKNKDDEKSISLVLEFAVGKVQDTIQRMIAIYEPACLIVGTRGRSLGGIQGLLPGSVSKYCLQNSPVPVIVVRPSDKREKKKRKRRLDPTRRAYMEILEKGGAAGSQVLDKVEREKLVRQTGGIASEKEAEAVARAIGLPLTFPDVSESRRGSDQSANGEGSALTKVTSAKSDYTSGAESPSPTEGLSPDESLMAKSPRFDDLESPEMSEDEDDDDVGEGEVVVTSTEKKEEPVMKVTTKTE